MQSQHNIGDEAMIDYTLFNSDKSCLRCTSDRVPSTCQQLKESQIPYGITVKPFGDGPNVSNHFDVLTFCIGGGSTNSLIQK